MSGRLVKAIETLYKQRTKFTQTDNKTRESLFADPIHPFRILHVGIFQIGRLCVSTNGCLLVGTSLFCCPSIFARALRAAIVAAELPLRGKLRAEATTFFIDQRILAVVRTRTRTRTNTNPNGTEANAAGRSVRHNRSAKRLSKY